MTTTEGVILGSLVLIAALILVARNRYENRRRKGA